MSLTMPQILMLGHASKVNYLRMQEKIERDRKGQEAERAAVEKVDDSDPMTQFGKRMSELNSDELMQVMLGPEQG